MLAEKVRLARKEVKAAQSLILQAELKARRRVLRRLGYVDSEGVVTVKGRAAAEIQSADELVLTELMFNGIFKVRFKVLPVFPPVKVWQFPEGLRGHAARKGHQSISIIYIYIHGECSKQD